MLMKKILVLLLCAFMLTSFVGCSSRKLAKPETNLDFWIAENVDAVDFSEYHQRYGMMGGQEYYGKGYTPTVDENGEQKDPEECVIYTITNYPDYMSRNKHVTRITITDPNVTVYGLSMNSSNEDIEATMKSNGFKAVEIGDRGYVEWVKGKFHIQFSDEVIRIKVEVSNFLKIQF
jgi:hypothetical protein